jgi:RHS repeat-associated protein
VSGQSYTLGYDAEGHLVSVSGPSMSASFAYDGDGARVKSTINGTVTGFVGTYYEKTGSTVTKYYYAGGDRIATRTGSTLNYLLSDHMGSTSITTDASGSPVAELRYKAWGETRYASGSTPTRYQFQGQYSNEAEFGLVYMNARWYDGALGRMAQADTVVPNGVQGYDRYAFVNNNPVNHTDPTGHCEESDLSCQVILSQTLPPPPTIPASASSSTSTSNSASSSTSNSTWTSSLASPAALPSSPWACDWLDCILSMASIGLSALQVVPPTMIALAPMTTQDAVLVWGALIVGDIIVTGISIERTNAEYEAGKISAQHRDYLNSTAKGGLWPIIGTVSGYFNWESTSTGVP